jgi:enoyl-CoA hydratase/carnithine racemase
MTAPVRVTSGRVATVEMCRPESKNALSYELVAALADALDDLARVDTRAVVLAAEGKHFCAGADLNRRQEPDRPDAPHVYDAALRLFEQPLPLIAAMSGAAVGGGLGLALVADFRVASHDARFSANFATLGFHPGFGISVTLPRLVGVQTAADLLYTGRRIDATEAHALGLVDETCERDELVSRAHARAEQIAAAAPLALRSIRATQRAALSTQVRDVLAREKAEQVRLMQTEDFREGVAATKERRTAHFLGR